MKIYFFIKQISFNFNRNINYIIVIFAILLRRNCHRLCLLATEFKIKKIKKSEDSPLVIAFLLILHEHFIARRIDDKRSRI
jgi:hypothetical protein